MMHLGTMVTKSRRLYGNTNHVSKNSIIMPITANALTVWMNSPMLALMG